MTDDGPSAPDLIPWTILRLARRPVVLGVAMALLAQRAATVWFPGRSPLEIASALGALIASVLFEAAGASLWFDRIRMPSRVAAAVQMLLGFAILLRSIVLFNTLADWAVPTGGRAARLRAGRDALPA